MAKRKKTTKPSKKEEARNILLSAIADLVVGLIVALVSHFLER